MITVYSNIEYDEMFSVIEDYTPVPEDSNFRLLEDNDFRITEDDELRILE